jgi:transcriptional regulator with XRE-family HTH domain
MDDSGVHQRIRDVLKEYSVRQVAHSVGMNYETVRRYMLGHSPSAEFLARICQVYDISGTWILLGLGPMRLGVFRNCSMSESLKEYSQEPIQSNRQQLSIQDSNHEEGETLTQSERNALRSNDDLTLAREFRTQLSELRERVQQLEREQQRSARDLATTRSRSQGIDHS